MAKSKEMCKGCRNDYYNQTQPDGCWSFESAKIVKRIQVGYWEPPPYKYNPQEVLSCYHQVGFSWIKLDDCRVKR